MINWETDNEDFFTVNSEATDLIHLENELTESITRIIELKPYNHRGNNYNRLERGHL